LEYIVYFFIRIISDKMSSYNRFQSRFIDVIKSLYNELIIIFLLIFLINNYIGNVDKTINADGKGYYDYLPSLIIHHDLNRHNLNPIQEPEKFSRVKSFGVYVYDNGKPVNKYSCGVATLEFPFFMACRLVTGNSNTPDDGYQTPYQISVFYAAIFYLFLAIYFLKKILVIYKCNNSTIILAQLLLVLGTSVTNYVNFDASFSHIYSLFAITAFVYFVKKYFERRSFVTYIFVCVFLGLIILIRPVNIMIISIIPFLAGSFLKIKEEVVYLLKHLPKTTFGIILLLSIIAIQPLLWYLQTGDWFIYTYKQEGFNFMKPEIMNVLFSYRKGLFVYTPILLFSQLSFIWFLIKRKYYELFTSFLFFVIITYVISSWSIWDYGGSYGLRAYVDYYSIFFILFAIMFDKLLIWSKIILVVPAIFLVYLNLVQTYQYKEFILHWQNMDKEKYWTVFMKTDERYKGLIWEWGINLNKVKKTDEIKLGSFNLPAHSDSVLCNFSTDNLKDIKNIRAFQIRITNDFKDENDASLSLTITDTTGEIAYFHDRYVLHFNSVGLNKYQVGSFNYILPQKLTKDLYNIKLRAYMRNSKLDIKDVSISVFSDK